MSGKYPSKRVTLPSVTSPWIPRGFVIAAAHDLNNELSIVLSAAERVIDELPKDHPEYPRAIALRKASQQCVRVASAMLQYAKNLN